MNACELFLSLYDALPFGVLITDRQPETPKIIYANPKACGISGYSLEEILGKNPKMFQGPKTDRAVIDRLKECLRNGTPYLGSTWNYRKNGEPYLLSWRITEIQVFEEKYFVAIQQDLAEITFDPLQALWLLYQKYQATTKELLNRVSMANYLLKTEGASRAELTTIIDLSVKAISDMSQLVEFISEQSVSVESSH